MGYAKTQTVYTVEEYLAFERQAEERHQYVDGEIYAMAGESLAHSTICFNLAAVLGGQLRGKPCRGLSPNMKIRSGHVLLRRRQRGVRRAALPRPAPRRVAKSHRDF